MKKKLKVLLVEDEQMIALSLKLDMEDIGLTVLKTASTGKEAIKIARENDPDIILMDIQLIGEIDGIQAAEQILAEKNIPIVFMSGYTTDLIRKRTARLNPLAYLDKPVDISDIKKVIDDLIAS